MSTSTSYAGENLLTLREDKDRNLLPEEQAQAFHHIISQLLFLCMRARPDIQPLVAFLKKRVISPDEDNWGN